MQASKRSLLQAAGHNNSTALLYATLLSLQHVRVWSLHVWLMKRADKLHMVGRAACSQHSTGRPEVHQP